MELTKTEINKHKQRAKQILSSSDFVIDTKGCVYDLRKHKTGKETYKHRFSGRINDTTINGGWLNSVYLESFINTKEGVIYVEPISEESYNFFKENLTAFEACINHLRRRYMPSSIDRHFMGVQY